MKGPQTKQTNKKQNKKEEEQSGEGVSHTHEDHKIARMAETTHEGKCTCRNNTRKESETHGNGLQARIAGHIRTTGNNDVYIVSIHVSSIPVNLTDITFWQKAVTHK